MKILGIESSCDETAAAVVEDGRNVLSSAVYTQIQKHRPYGGVVPEIASRCHTEAIVDVVKEALDKADAKLCDIDAVAVTCAPGLIGALLVGVNFAKGLSLAANIPLVPVNHTRGHIAANYITNKELEPPFLCLVVSGGHTDLIYVEEYTKFKVLGCTRDDAAGETFDKAARAMGIGYPGGVELDKIAENGNAATYPLPKPEVQGHPLDFSFSGLKTAVVNTIHNAEQKGDKINVPDMAAALRSAVVENLIDHIEKGCIETGCKKIAIAGGVSANLLLRRKLKDKFQNDYKLYIPDIGLCGDNGAMIAAQGYYEFINGNTADMSLNASANGNVEEIIK